MHRSGTSLVARLAFETGMDMGDPATFQGGNQWNPDGYFEQKELIGLNMRLIHGRFSKLSYFHLPSGETILRRARRRERELRHMAVRYSARLVKDTRFCLTLPAWVDHGARVDDVVVCLREPLAVASSLRKRNWISLQRGYGLWVEHYRRLLAATQATRVMFVRYEDLVDPECTDSEISSLFAFLGWPYLPERITELKDLCVKPGMNHHPGGEMDYPPEVRSMREELLRRHADFRASVSGLTRLPAHRARRDSPQAGSSKMASQGL